MINIPDALVLGCNTPHGINVLSDYIQEQTGCPPEFHESGWDTGFKYNCNVNYYGLTTYSDGDGIGCGYGYGSIMNTGNGFSHIHMLGSGFFYGFNINSPYNMFDPCNDGNGRGDSNLNNLMW